MPVTLGTLLPMYDGSGIASDLYAVDLQYAKPSTDYLIFDWNDIGSSNPVYIPFPTDRLVVDFTPHQGPQSIGQVIFDEGTSFAADPRITDLGSVSYGYGTTLTSAAKFTPIEYFNPIFYEGSQTASSLATTVVLTGDGDLYNYDGSEADSTLHVSPAGPITAGYFEFDDGSTVLSTISTKVLFSPVFYDGTEVDTTQLITCPGCNSLPTVFYDGSEMDTSFAVFQYLATTISDGTEMDTVVTPYPAWREANPIFFDGSSLASNLATDIDLTGDGPAVNFDGTEMDTVFTPNPPWRPTIAFSDGSSSILAGLATKVILTLVAYDGTELDSSIVPNPQYQPGAVFSYGSTMVLATIAAQQSLPTLVAYDGTSLTFQLGNLANWYFYDGTQVDSTLSTTIDFTADGNLVNPTGESFLAELNVAPAQPLADVINIYTGESLSPTLRIRPHANLAVVFQQDMYLQFDFSTSTHSFDLARQCAVSQPDSYYFWQDPKVHWFNLTNGGTQKQPGALSTGFNMFMNITLAVHEHFQPLPMGHGETFGIYNFWPLLEVPGTIGFGMQVLDLKFDLAVPLCVGNFIPDGNAVDAELSTIDNTSCSVDQAYDGSHMSVHMQADYQEATTWYVGEQVDSTLTTSDPWFFEFAEGSFMHVPSQVDLTINFGHGEFLTVEFAPLTITFFDGSTLTAPGVNTNYFVEFLEVGCLENEYIDTKTIVTYNPFPAPPTANIELRPFFHQILADCT